MTDGHFDPVAVNGQGIFREQLLENLRHTPMHKHSPFARLGKALQARHNSQSIADPVRTAMFATGTVDHAVDSMMVVQTQKGPLVQECTRRHGGGQTDQFDVETVGLVECFLAVKAHHRQAQTAVGQGQGKRTFLVIEHSDRLCQAIRA